MPTPAYLSMEGKTQGKITEGSMSAESVGSIGQEAHEDEVLVEAFSHEITIATDPQSGQPTGQRVHKPLVITKVFDKSSPKLYNACTQGERMKKVIIKWYRTAADGTQEHYFTHELEEAIIVDIKAYMPNCQDPGKAQFTHLEDVSFTYRKITWTHVTCGTSGADDWKKPRA